MFCNKCGSQITDGGNFCPSCGAKVEVAGNIPNKLSVCSSCGENLIPDNKFCIKCGKSIVPDSDTHSSNIQNMQTSNSQFDVFINKHFKLLSFVSAAIGLVLLIMFNVFDSFFITEWLFDLIGIHGPIENIVNCIIISFGWYIIDLFYNPIM